MAERLRCLQSEYEAELEQHDREAVAAMLKQVKTAPVVVIIIIIIIIPIIIIIIIIMPLPHHSG
jgi:type IV secretory pathway component VirB8